MLINNNSSEQMSFDLGQSKKKATNTPSDSFRICYETSASESEVSTDGYEKFALQDDIELAWCRTDGTITGLSSPNGYKITFEYAKNSTKENPIMNVTCHNHNTGEVWEGAININEIDISNANHMEMVVLSTHLTGNPVPLDGSNMGIHDPLKKSDYFKHMESVLEKLKKQSKLDSDDTLYQEMKEKFSLYEEFYKQKEERESNRKASLENQFQQDKFVLAFRTS